MIQDWGSNYVYLRQQEVITRINLADHSYSNVARTPVEDLESATNTEKSSIPSWVNSRIHRWMSEASDAEGSDNEHDIDEVVFYDERDCKIVPLRTIQVSSSDSEESSVQSQQDMVSNSVEPNPTYTLRQIDSVIIHHVPSFDDSTKRFKTVLGITFEVFYPDPPNCVCETPLLMMLEEPESKIIVYKDMNHNFYRPIPPSNLSEEESKGWFPFLSRMNPENNQALIVSRTFRLSTPETTPTPDNYQQVVRPTLSHPPGFDPKLIPQPMNVTNESRKHESESNGPRLVGMSTLQERAIPFIRTCARCAIDHLIRDCPLKDNPIQPQESEDNIKNDQSMHNHYPLIPRYVEQGDQLVYNKYPEKITQGEVNFLGE